MSSTALFVLAVVIGASAEDAFRAEFILRPRDIEDDANFVFAVRSLPEDARRRDLVRRTWGSRSLINGQKVRIIFTMGRNSRPELRNSRPELRWIEKSKSSLEEEAEKFGDVLQADFYDIGRNSSYNDLAAFAWINATSSFIVTSNDRVFIEVFHLLKFASAVYGRDRKKALLVCQVLPSRLKREHCSDLGYMVTPDLASLFVTSADLEDAIDDTYVTGRLRRQLNVSPFYLNLRYTRDPMAGDKWLEDGNGLPFPFLFYGPIDNDDLWLRLWRKTVAVHKAEEELS